MTGEWIKMRTDGLLSVTIGTRVRRSISEGGRGEPGKQERDLTTKLLSAMEGTISLAARCRESHI